MTRRPLLLVATSALLATVTACDNPSDAPSEASKPTEETSRQSERTVDGDSTWAKVTETDLSESGQKKLERARSAQKQLGQSLKKELKKAVSEKSFSGAVEFCHAEAPAIAERVAENQDVAVGRTSHKLRNPDNTPPDWATAAVERRKAKQYVFRGPDQRLGYLRPIELQGLCLNCHGSKDQLAPGVQKKLETHYPEDQATGFRAGDLRGWFWVEVPGES